MPLFAPILQMSKLRLQEGSHLSKVARLTSRDAPGFRVGPLPHQAERQESRVVKQGSSSLSTASSELCNPGQGPNPLGALDSHL